MKTAISKLLTIICALNNKRLSNRDFSVLVEVCYEDDPFSTVVRKRIVERLNIGTTLYSNILAKLVKQGFLIKGGIKGDYTISSSIKNLIDKLKQDKVMKLTITIKEDVQGDS